MMTTLMIVSVLAVLYRVLHIAAVVNLDHAGTSRVHMIGLAVHIAMSAAGAVLYLVGILTANIPAILSAAWFLLVAMAALTFVDKRTHWP